MQTATAAPQSVIDELVTIPWTADDGADVYTYYAEGFTASSWFCFEADTLDDLKIELDALGFDAEAEIREAGL